jgi:urease accessory protein
MMLGIGLFAGRLGGNARWQLPLAFLSAMTIGWVSAVMGYAIPGVESGIVAGLIVLGVMLMLRTTMPFVVQLFVVAMFATLHGAAHGAELSNAMPLATGMGMLLATALLHGIGVVIAALISIDRQSLYRGLGALFTVVGGSFLFSA